MDANTMKRTIFFSMTSTKKEYISILTILLRRVSLTIRAINALIIPIIKTDAAGIPKFNAKYEKGTSRHIIMAITI